TRSIRSRASTPRRSPARHSARRCWPRRSRWQVLSGMRTARTARATTPSAAPSSSAWCATGCATAIRPPRNGRARSAGWAPPIPEKSRRWSRSCRRCEDLGGAGLGQQLLQLAALVHLERDVTAAEQLALHVQLRVGRPVREALERFAHLRLLENVDVLEL